MNKIWRSYKKELDRIIYFEDHLIANNKDSVKGLRLRARRKGLIFKEVKEGNYWGAVKEKDGGCVGEIKKLSDHIEDFSVGRVTF